MTDREKVIAAYECYNEKIPDKRCEKCPFGYEYIDQTGDNYFVGCNTERMMVDAIDLLRAPEPKLVHVIADINHRKIGECPTCGKWINSRDYPNYCGRCGQVVKWE